ncbi:MAG TPA: hypothetical protein VNF29_02535, partial [Candidatus Binataceae bacterium]|nr:hypothetical protein [Candidatus Binataceae bacterium]
MAKKRKRAKTVSKIQEANGGARQASPTSPPKTVSRGFGARTWFLPIAANVFAAIVFVLHARAIGRPDTTQLLPRYRRRSHPP